MSQVYLMLILPQIVLIDNFELQGNSYIDPLRYLGVASVVSGSFCVCLAMCRWLGRPMAGHSSSLEVSSLIFINSNHVQITVLSVTI